MVGDQGEREARALGERRLADELVRPVLLGGERVSELHGAGKYLFARRRNEGSWPAWRWRRSASSRSCSRESRSRSSGRACVDYADHEGAAPWQLGALRSLPEKRWSTIDEVAEALVRVQPAYAHEDKQPREESGAPPGGDAYTEKHPESGEVRGRTQRPGLVVAFVPCCPTRSRCGSTMYLGSRADWKPALKTAQRRHSSPAQTSAPPVTAAARLFLPRVASSAAPAVASAFAAARELAGLALPVDLADDAEPPLHQLHQRALGGDAGDREPSRRPGLARMDEHARRGARARGRARAEEPRQLAARLVPDRDRGVGEQHARVGRERRAAERRDGLGAALHRRQPPEQLERRRGRRRAAADEQDPAPTLIGDVTLKTRSMLRKRSGRPRSVISSAGETSSAAAPT